MIKDLKYWLSPIDKIFADYKKHTLDADNPEKHRIFIDRGSDILFVAHLDTVQTPKLIKTTDKRIYAAGLDDRLGCMAAFNLSKELGVDLLLTDHEERIHTTAEFHTCKKYNWIAEFDRGGGDVVTYDLDNKDFLDVLGTYFIIGFGSFSDIVALNTESCCVNIGIGYQHAHSKDSYVDLKVYRKQIKAFRVFFDKHKDQKYIRDEKQADTFQNYNYKKQWYGDPDCCDICGFADGIQVFGHVLCSDCVDYMVESCGIY